MWDEDQVENLDGNYLNYNSYLLRILKYLESNFDFINCSFIFLYKIIKQIDLQFLNFYCFNFDFILIHNFISQS